MQIDYYLCQHCKQKTIPCSSEDGILTEECPQCGGSIWTEPPTAADCWDGDETDKIPC